MTFGEKIRPNVIILALMTAIVTVIFGVMLIGLIENSISNEILALLVGIGVGGYDSCWSSCHRSAPAYDSGIYA